MPNPTDLLPTIEIARTTGWNDTPADRSALTRYLQQEPIREWLGGKATHPKYPADAAPRFKQMLAWHREGMTPKMMLVAAQRGVAAAVPDVAETALAVAAPADLPILARDMAQPDAEALIDRLADRLGKVMAAPRDDKFLNREEAAALLCCNVHAVGRYVRPVRANVWSFLDIQEHMAEAREKAHAKPRKGAGKVTQ